MKNIIYTVIIILSTYGCNTSKTSVKIVNNENENKVADTIRISNSDLEYEIVIIELGFESWLATQKPMSYYTNNTLAVKNYQYVLEWNQRVLNPQRYNYNLYEQKIDYEMGVDYGMEVNYKLYMYFMFFQQKYKQKL